MTLETVYKIYLRRWHLNGNSYSTRCIHFSELFRFKLFKLYSNMLKCVNLIEIWFYASCFFVLGHIIFETTAQIPEVEFGGKYGYMRANTGICPYLPWGQVQKRTYCNKTCDNCCYSIFIMQQVWFENVLFISNMTLYWLHSCHLDLSSISIMSLICFSWNGFLFAYVHITQYSWEILLGWC